MKEEDDSKVFGHKYQPRSSEPSMKQLLTWETSEVEASYNKKSKKAFNCLPEYYKSQFQINRNGEANASEYQNQYKNLEEQERKTKEVRERIEFDQELEEEDSTRRQAEMLKEESREPIESQQKSKKLLVRNISEFKSSSCAPEYIDKYSLRELTTREELVQHLKKTKAEHELTFGKKHHKASGAAHVPKTTAPRQVESIIDWPEPSKEQQKDPDGSRPGKGLPDGAREAEEEIETPVERPDYSRVQSKLYKEPKKAKKLDPRIDKEKLSRRHERIKKLNETTRWLPNSAFQTYFGKPAFENYGNANTNPAVGGTLYGQYMYTHNVNPHRGSNNPKHVQVYPRAEDAAQDVRPEPPRFVSEEHRLSQKQVEELKARNQLTADRRINPSISTTHPTY